jgi:4-amino-4-deoxy-L-arabinose transferase-like glycosyltransferase
VRRAVPAERVHLAALAVITMLAAAIRMQFLGGDMRFDEAQLFVNLGRGPLHAIVTSYDDPGNHVLHTILQHFAWRMFGDAPEVVRLPALVAGIAIILAVYAAARTLYDRDIGLIAAALCAPAGALVEYSVNGRGYTLMLVLTLLLVPVGALGVTRRAPLAWILFAALAALGFYTVPTMVYGLGIVVAWLVMLALELPRGERAAALSGLACALLGAAAIAAVLYRPLLGQTGWSYQAPYTSSVRFIAEGFGSGFGPLRWILLAGIVVAVALHTRLARRRAPLWLAVAVMVPAGIALSPHVPPFIRSWLAVLPFLLILAAAGITALGRAIAARAAPKTGARPHAAPAAAIAIAALLGLGVSGNVLPQSEDPPAFHARAAARWLSTRAAADDGIVVGSFAYPAISYELFRAGYPARRFDIRGLLAGTPPFDPARPIWLVAIDARDGTTQAEAASVLAGAKTAPVVYDVSGARVYRIPARR